MLGAVLLTYLVIAVVVFLIGAAIFQWLWNITMPEVFGLQRIRYWISLRLLLIAMFLTSGGLIHFHGAR